VSGRFDELLRQAQAAYAASELDRSLELFGEAEAFARSLGDVDLVDTAYCQRAFVLIQTGRGEPEIPELKKLFLRSPSRRNRWSAAYNLSDAYCAVGDADAARGWAERATHLATEAGDADLRIRSMNTWGRLALQTSRFDDAEMIFTDILDGLGGEQRLQPENANQVLDNLGYARMCNGNLDDGIELCERARAGFEAIGADHLLYETLQDLCYGHLLAGDLERAHECGERALDLAVEHEDDQVAKNCLFLLSETAVRHGDTFRARRYLRELTAYYPEVGIGEEIIDVFLVTDLTSVVNLRG
jgi:tetratricopeptide (TPR) repeat protein